VRHSQCLQGVQRSAPILFRFRQKGQISTYPTIKYKYQPRRCLIGRGTVVLSSGASYTANSSAIGVVRKSQNALCHHIAQSSISKSWLELRTLSGFKIPAVLRASKHSAHPLAPAASRPSCQFSRPPSLSPQTITLQSFHRILSHHFRPATSVSVRSYPSGKLH
jgi:hypothetical protein